MNEEQRIAYVIAQAAVLNATIAGMVAENEYRKQCGNQIAYDEICFVKAVESSGLHHNAVVPFLLGG